MGQAIKLTSSMDLVSTKTLENIPVLKSQFTSLTILGVYVTRNRDVYKYGRFEMSYNKAYGNGINGLVVHKTDRVRVVGNVLWDNGKVSKSKPESRQPYAGLTVSGSKDVEVKNNFVKTELTNDYAFMAAAGSTLNNKSGNNKVRKRH